MKVLVIGSGGREHALLWKLSQSPSVTDVYVVPGNDGMSDVASLIPIKGNEDIIDFARLMQVDLTVAGPETVLTEGLADEFEKRGMAFFGPSKAAARIEGSKGFAKALMKKYGIPTAAYETFDDEEKAIAYLKANDTYPIVIKADGLASGKGVIIAQSEEEAIDTVKDMLEGHTFSGAGRSVVIEEFMEGEEASMLCFCDGTNVVPMISAQDHKRIFDFDKGPNTGGMGAYAPAPVMTKEMCEEVNVRILRPIVAAMKKEGYPFKGCLYAGLMITSEGPKVVEFNCRFGDPETEAVLPLFDGDLARVMLDCVHGTLSDEAVVWKKACAVDVVLASEGYPASHSSGEVISGIEDAKKAGCLVFHAGTVKKNGQYVVNGGRVLNVVALADTLAEAKAKAYEGVSRISWRGMQYRHDIADKGLLHLETKK
ncbi:MAG: phosphoribosylamine--glycine ligase [Dialister sp.]|uniref:phosphoribosylamine--glycine ligase n=1 Tax=Dialister sp. TaxID=1955814 RepID=UPI002984F95D|nr:phosphoribosylamine--glycine ligase [Dialister sp.]MCI6916484.1 phosphoribosylamine--glycine ligase [Dialister sp.]MCI7172779.1 phosphoribosylamine--glycine ligase [Dialister sp.]MCI7318946.1 phosphoribosylamine--glycine ligase [Dialister sp.]MDD6904302.1 phosphoribosylamine--glycine ligase [Dialister sp.]